jgi:hypothetical protein
MGFPECNLGTYCNLHPAFRIYVTYTINSRLSSMWDPLYSYTSKFHGIKTDTNSCLPNIWITFVITPYPNTIPTEGKFIYRHQLQEFRHNFIQSHFPAKQNTVNSCFNKHTESVLFIRQAEKVDWIIVSIQLIIFIPTKMTACWLTELYVLNLFLSTENSNSEAVKISSLHMTP